MGDLTKDFSKREFTCKCGCGAFIPCERLTGVVQAIRDAAGAAVTVNSGTRCAKNNAAAGGVANSAHLAGEAADIYVKGATQWELYQLIRREHAAGKLPALRYCYKIEESTRAVHVGVDEKPRKSVFG